MEAQGNNQMSPPPSRSASQDTDPGPLDAYNFFLRNLGDSYIDFFSERLKIEEQYRDAMERLLNRQRMVDAVYDARLPDWTLRKAWKDISDGLERETDVQNALINSLRADVVNPLLELKETHERSRKRIKEGMKESKSQYKEYSESTLPRLKRTYFRRCQELEDLKAADEPKAIPSVTSPVISNPMPPGKPNPPQGTNPQAQSGASSGPPRGRQTSIGLPKGRDRSPGGGTSLSDLAQQGKRQLNNLRTLIETKGGTNAKAEHALRGVRLKREAEEADKEYRKGVHEMETLRLRRAKILEAGYTSVETLVAESSETIKKVIERYSDGLTATNTTNSQLSDTLREASHEIDTTQDLNHLRQLTSKTLAAAIPKPILYQNYHVGECKDMLFGVSLVDYASSRGLKDPKSLPKIVSLCIKEVEARGLKLEGIYRVSGRLATVMEMAHDAEKSEADFKFDSTKDDVACIGALLKYYLRDLPEPVFKFPIVERAQYTEDREKHVANKFATIRGKIRRLPPIHQAVLRAVLEHLAKVNANQPFNRMDAKNLAVVFGTVIFGEESLPAGVDILNIAKDTLMEDLINNVRLIYDIEERPSSPPLPVPPVEEEDGSNKPFTPIYGSSHTVIKTLPANGPDAQPPKLPPRPNKSSTSRRATVSSVNDTVTPAPARSSEDGRANTYQHAKVASLVMPKGPKLELKTGGKSNSASSSPINEIYRDRGDKSSRNTSEVKLTPTVDSVSTGIGSWPGIIGAGIGGSGSAPTTASSAFSKDRIHVDSLKDTGAMVSDIRVKERTGSQDVDYPGSPDTSALEFSTAVNTPTDDPPNPFTLPSHEV